MHFTKPAPEHKRDSAPARTEPFISDSDVILFAQIVGATTFFGYH